MNSDYKTYLVGVVIIGIILKLFFNSEFYQLQCITSPLDNNTYCVRDRKNKEKTVNLLSTLTMKMKKMVKLMGKYYGEQENVKRLVENFNPTRIKETIPSSSLVAYSENKGEKMAFCVTKKKNGSKFIDENTLTFVALHELAHIMTLSIGHTPEFWDNFKFLLEHAVEFKIYHPINYNDKNIEYCGMTIKDNPLFD